jgi:hypothetical protein
MVEDTGGATGQHPSSTHSHLLKKEANERKCRLRWQIERWAAARVPCRLPPLSESLTLPAQASAAARVLGKTWLQLAGGWLRRFHRGESGMHKTLAESQTAVGMLSFGLDRLQTGA